MAFPTLLAVGLLASGGQTETHAVVPLLMAETQVRGWLLQGWDKFATAPQVLSLEGTAKEGDKETGGILRRHI